MKSLLFLAAVALTIARIGARIRRRFRPVELQPTALEQANYDRLYREIHGGEV